MEISQIKQKYIFVGGGVASGIGKGITTSSIAYLLQSAGYNITIIKIDPYLNIDAGTLNPIEHGEVYVLNDGGEVDLDLGNYERFLNINFTGEHNITSGKVYSHIINKEREGQYLGQTIQVIPHVVQDIMRRIITIGKTPVSNNDVEPDIVLIEMGGTIGDFESDPYFEAARQLQFELGNNSVCLILVTLVPQLSDGEHKTKPSQNAIISVRIAGLQADLIIVRSSDPVPNFQLNKIGRQANLKSDYVINLVDVKNIFSIPSMLDDKNVSLLILQKLQLQVRKSKIEPMIALSKYLDTEYPKCQIITIGIVGKYLINPDSYVSLIKATEIATWAAGVKLNRIMINAEMLEEKWFSDEKNKDEALLKKKQYDDTWNQLKSCNGIIIPGGYGIRGFQGKVNAVNYCRLNNVPILGICFGFQAMVIEYARNMLGLKQATTSEFYKCNENQDIPTDIPFLIDDMPDASLTILGGTMRRGRKKTIITDKDSMAYRMYGKTEFYERYRHRFEVNKDYIDELKQKGINFTGVDESGKRMEILELKNHKFFFGVQFHPEFKARIFQPSPVYLGFILATIDKFEELMKNGEILYKFKYLI